MWSCLGREVERWGGDEEGETVQYILYENNYFPKKKIRGKIK